MSGKKYLIANPLVENSSRHCATLAIEKFISKDGSNVRVNSPDENSRNGTVTFVKSEGRIFAITCWHVIEFLRDLEKIEGKSSTHSFFTMTPTPKAMFDTFIRPSSTSEYHQLDIGIRQVTTELLDFMSKEPIDIDKQQPPNVVEFGIVVGFPEGLKYEKKPNAYSTQRIISLPTVSIVVETDVMPDRKFRLFSEFDKVQEYETYSGMSGSPIFWSIEQQYGIFGIACEVNRLGQLDGGKSMIVEGELATPDVIRHWIKQIPSLND